MNLGERGGAEGDVGVAGGVEEGSLLVEQEGVLFDWEDEDGGVG